MRISYGRHRLPYVSGDTKSSEDKPMQPVSKRWPRDYHWDQSKHFMGIATQGLESK
jgi:hypothetical protein